MASGAESAVKATTPAGPAASAIKAWIFANMRFILLPRRFPDP
jgi:hypothetical protein